MRLSTIGSLIALSMVAQSALAAEFSPLSMVCSTQYTIHVEQIKAKGLFSKEKRKVIIDEQVNPCNGVSNAFDLRQEASIGCEVFTALSFGIEFKLNRLTENLVEAELYAIGKDIPFGPAWDIAENLRATGTFSVTPDSPGVNLIYQAPLVIGEERISKRVRQITTITKITAECRH